MPRNIHPRTHRKTKTNTGRSHSHIKHRTYRPGPITEHQIQKAVARIQPIVEARAIALQEARKLARVTTPIPPAPVAVDSGGHITECRRHQKRYDTACTTCRRIVRRIGRESGKCPLHPTGAFGPPCDGCAAARRTRTSIWTQDQVVYSTESGHEPARA